MGLSNPDLIRNRAEEILSCAPSPLNIRELSSRVLETLNLGPEVTQKPVRDALQNDYLGRLATIDRGIWHLARRHKGNT